MLILALDLATQTGFAFGEAGTKPRVGSVRLKRPGEDAETASFNLLCFLEDQFLSIPPFPDLVVAEAAMNIAAQKSADAVNLQIGCHHVVGAVVRRRGIAYRTASSDDVSRHFVGKARWSKADGGRAAKKAAAIARAILLGYLPRGARNDNEADACAVFDYASAHFARKPPRSLIMFGEVTA